MHKLWLHNPAVLALLVKDKLKGFIPLKLAYCLSESMFDIFCYTHFASYFRTTCISPISLLPAAPESMGLKCQNILRLTHNTIIITSYLLFTFIFPVSIFPDSFAPLILAIIIYISKRQKPSLTHILLETGSCLLFMFCFLNHVLFFFLSFFLSFFLNSMT